MHFQLKLRYISALLGFLLFFLGTAQPAHAIDGFIKLTSPNGGENLKEGQSHTITWDSSSNIDKVNIGYSSGPGHLDWVVFTTANTGSYTWNVDVGNTTNTQFIIDITGYETGKGSVSDKSDGYFTVTQKEEYPPKPSPTGQPQSSPISSTKPTSSMTPRFVTDYAPGFGPSPTPMPSPKPITIIYKTLNLNPLFIFDGSRTTTPATITDPTQVKDFTFDTPLGFTFIFTDELNLTNKETLQALTQVSQDWVIEEYSFWIQMEWWVKYEMISSIEVMYTSSELTEFPPLITNELTVSEVAKVAPQKAASYAPQTSYRLLEAEKGQLKLQVTDGIKLKINPKVELTEPARLETTRDNMMLMGKTSHKSVLVTTKINGQIVESEISPIQDNGSFKIFLRNLNLGTNFTQFYFNEPGKEPQLFAERNIIYQPVWYEVYRDQLIVSGLVLLTLTSVGGGIGLSHFWPQLKTRLSKLNKVQSKPPTTDSALS